MITNIHDKILIINLRTKNKTLISIKINNYVTFPTCNFFIYLCIKYITKPKIK